jgi:hypothetical protein
VSQNRRRSSRLHDLGPLPDGVIHRIESDPMLIFDALDHEITCGIAVNPKEMDKDVWQIAQRAEVVARLVDFLAPMCRLD